MTCTGIVLTARIYLPKWRAAGYEDENIMRRRHGTDDAEKLFSKSCGANPNADSKDKNHNVSGNVSRYMKSLALSRKANCGRARGAPATELNSGKFSRKKSKSTKS